MAEGLPEKAILNAAIKARKRDKRNREEKVRAGGKSQRSMFSGVERGEEGAGGVDEKGKKPMVQQLPPLVGGPLGPPSGVLVKVGAAAIDNTNAAIVNHAKMFLYTGKGGASVPDNVVRLRVDPSVYVIHPKAIAGHMQLINIEFCKGLCEIQYRAFAGCTALVGPLRMLLLVRIIHEGTFEYCTALTEVMLQDGLKEICNFTFWGCMALRRVRIGGPRRGSR
jgi:hypothetical protein